MIESTVFITYVSIVFGFVFIPGPATLLTVALASSSGTRVGLATGAGIAVGDLFHTLMAVIGVSAIIAASATLFSIIKFIGAGYLLYLGIRTLLQKTHTFGGMNLPLVNAKSAFIRAVITEVFNPKTALFFLAFLPQFIRTETGSPALQLAELGITFVALGLLSTAVFSLSAGWIGEFMRKRPSALKLQGKITGLIYCGLGIRIVMQGK
ncbi:lysine transporter LysE [Brenneria goodwinii]|uniref:Lysine transporter LysE n=1 Tax=Brenneria goodwinii TaxID=1109412 RepID=A0AAE8EQS7_9GAMM|nr:LysE family translocator [Brenneria goodwinii]ATA23952.1 lysine transporter LysE [Brenneria goodwinii]RLM28040.1 lysine transporter LysE [Brenneria goodwinii]